MLTQGYYRYAKLAAEKNGGVTPVRVGVDGDAVVEDSEAGQVDVDEDEGEDEGEDEDEEWVLAQDEYKDDEEDEGDNKLGSDSPDSDSSDSDSDFDSDSGSGDTNTHSSKQPCQDESRSPVPMTEHPEVDLSFEEEQEFLRLSREFAKQLEEQEADREAAEENWTANVQPRGKGEKGGE